MTTYIGTQRVSLHIGEQKFHINVKNKATPERLWTRPNLTASGTMGGTAFAVSASINNTTAYRGVDDSVSTYWSVIGSTARYTFYNPDALKVSELTYIYSSSTFRAKAVSTEGSNDNSTWEAITSTYSGSSTTYTSILDNDKYYKYYRINFTANSLLGGIRLSDLLIIAYY